MQEIEPSKLNVTLQSGEKGKGQHPGPSCKTHVVIRDGRWALASLQSQPGDKGTHEPFYLPQKAPLAPTVFTLNFHTKVLHTDIVVAWLFIWGTVPTGLVCLLLWKTNLSSISHVF